MVRISGSGPFGLTCLAGSAAVWLSLQNVGVTQEPPLREVAKQAAVAAGKPATAQQISEWIRELDAAEFLTRETAMLQLLEAGPGVLPLLRPVLTTGSLEATSRALFIVRQIGLAADLDRQDEAGQLLEELAERKEAPALARRAAAALAELTQQRSAQSLSELEELGAKIARTQGNGIIGIDEPALSIEINEAFRGEEHDLRRLKWIIDVPVVILTGKRITDGWVKHALEMPGLEDLHLYKAQISDAGLAVVPEGSRLRQLGVYYTAVGDGIFPALAKAPLLNFVKLYGTQVTPGAEEKFEETSAVVVDRRKGAFLGVQGGDIGDSCPISTVHPGSPAEKAGLNAQDVIIRFNNEPVTSFTSLTKLISQCDATDEVEIEAIRPTTNEKVTVKATLGAWELETAIRNSRPR